MQRETQPVSIIDGGDVPVSEPVRPVAEIEVPDVDVIESDELFWAPTGSGGRERVIIVRRYISPDGVDMVTVRNPVATLDGKFREKNVPYGVFRDYQRSQTNRGVGGGALARAGVTPPEGELTSRVETMPPHTPTETLDALIAPLSDGDRMALWRLATAITEAESSRAKDLVRASAVLSGDSKLVARYLELFRQEKKARGV